MSQTAVVRLWRSFGLHHLDTVRLAADADFLMRIRTMAGVYLAASGKVVVVTCSPRTTRAGSSPEPARPHVALTLRDDGPGDGRRLEELQRFLCNVDNGLARGLEAVALFDMASAGHLADLGPWFKRHRRMLPRIAPRGTWRAIFDRWLTELTAGGAEAGSELRRLEACVSAWLGGVDRGSRALVWIPSTAESIRSPENVDLPRLGGSNSCGGDARSRPDGTLPVARTYIGHAGQQRRRPH